MKWFIRILGILITICSLGLLAISWGAIFGILFGALLIWGSFGMKKSETPGKGMDIINTLAHGPLRPEMICPHCQVKGKVHTQLVKHKKGISGGKAAGAILTGGLSILATGLSRKEKCTQAHCDNCGSTWEF